MSLTINHQTNDISATGAGSVTIDGATPGGGGSPDLFAENYDGTTTKPSATGNNAIAVGTSIYGGVDIPATASGSSSVALGANALASGGASVAMSRSKASGSYSFSAAGGNGQSYGASGYGAVAIGSSTNARADSSVALGQSAYTQTGTQSVAIGDSYASGSHSLAAAISTNTSTYGATETSSLALGSQAKAAGSYSVAIGSQATTISGFSGAVALGSSHAKGNNSIAAAIGNSGTQFGAIGNNSVAMGYEATTSSTASVAIGYRAKATTSDATVFGVEGQSAIQCKTAFGGRKFTSSGDCQGAKYILKAETTDATPKEMVTGYASSSVYFNRILALENNSAYAFHGTIVARQKASEGTASAAWKIEGLIRREGSDATTVLVNSTITALDNTPSWGLSLSANTATNAGNLAITVTGAASTNIRWASNIDTTELTYA